MLFVFESQVVHGMESIQPAISYAIGDSFRIDSVAFVQDIHYLIFKDYTLFLEVNKIRLTRLISEAKLTVFEIDQPWSGFGINKNAVE